MSDLSLPFDGHYEYRSLRLTNPHQHGADVYALQTALLAFNLPVVRDGVYGNHTKRAVENYQKAAVGLTADGIAGFATQHDMGRRLAVKYGENAHLPVGIPLGHVENESGYLLGNYTARYANGTRDEGIVQRNTQYATSAEAFSVTNSLRAIVQKIEDYHAKYVSWGVEFPRNWRLACGSWNAPAWTDTLAKGGQLSQPNYDWIVAYIDRVTAYAAAAGWRTT